MVPFEELSVVTAPTRSMAASSARWGWPTRMAYERMIQIVDITARLVGNALSHK